MCDTLTLLGAKIEDLEDGMRIEGRETLAGGQKVNSFGDHRIAMSLAIAGLRAEQEVLISDTACTETSFPGFWQLLSRIQAC